MAVKGNPNHAAVVLPKKEGDQRNHVEPAVVLPKREGDQRNHVEPAVVLPKREGDQRNHVEPAVVLPKKEDDQRNHVEESEDADVAVKRGIGAKNGIKSAGDALDAFTHVVIQQGSLLNGFKNSFQTSQEHLKRDGLKGLVAAKVNIGDGLKDT